MPTRASLPTLNFLTSDPACIDYRPAVDAAGATVVFERTPAQGGLTVLYRIDGLAASPPAPFLSGPSLPPSQTRPDWCWKTGAVAFNGALANDSGVEVWHVGSDGADPASIAGTTLFDYPTWGPDGCALVTENASAGASPRPCNSIFDLQGVVRHANIDGNDAASTALFGGMPAVGPNGLPQIAFAGQPAIVGWGGSNAAKPVYNESQNYVFLNSLAAGVFSSAPLESGAAVTSYQPQHQGRAPAWSPDGKTIAFESNRGSSNLNLYAIYLCDLASGTINQVTALGGCAQHAKFFPCGTKLVLCSSHPDRTPPTMGIAWVDISTLLL